MNLWIYGFIEFLDVSISVFFGFLALSGQQKQLLEIRWSQNGWTFQFPVLVARPERRPKGAKNEVKRPKGPPTRSRGPEGL